MLAEFASEMAQHVTTAAVFPTEAPSTMRVESATVTTAPAGTASTCLTERPSTICAASAEEIARLAVRLVFFWCDFITVCTLLFTSGLSKRRLLLLLGSDFRCRGYLDRN